MIFSIIQGGADLSLLILIGITIKITRKHTTACLCGCCHFLALTLLFILIIIGIVWCAKPFFDRDHAICSEVLFYGLAVYFLGFSFVKLFVAVVVLCINIDSNSG